MCGCNHPSNFLHLCIISGGKSGLMNTHSPGQSKTNNSYRVTESQTRFSLIDPELQKAGWNLSDRTQVKFEIPVYGYDGSGGGGFTDYTLYRTNGEIFAVVEAKRTSRDPREGEKQVLEYVTAIEKKQKFRSFAFMANGEDVFFWESDTTAQRHVAGFFSRENLERLLF